MSMPLTLKNIFKITSGIPILALMFALLYLIYINYEKCIENNNTKALLKEYLALKQLKITIDKEAEVGVLTLDKKNSYNVKIFTSEIQNTNRLIKYVYQENISEDINIFLTKMNKIRQNPKMDSFELLYAPYIDIYKQLNSEIIQKLTKILDHTSQIKSSSLINYMIFSQYIINTMNFQRDYINNLLITNTSLDDKQAKFWIDIVLENTDINPFMLISNDLKSKLYTYMPKEKVNDVFQSYTAIKTKTISDASRGIFDTPYRKWTEVANNKISLLNEYNNILYQNILSDLEEYKNSLVKKIQIYSFLLALCFLFFLGFIISIKNYNHLIKYFTYTIDNLKEKGYLDQKTNLNFDSKKQIQKTFLNIDESIKSMISTINFLQHTNQIKNDLISNIAHEIQAPLQGIISYIDLIDKTSPSILTKNIKEIAQNIFNMAKNIKENRKLENNQILINMSAFLPIQEFEKTTQAFALLALNKDIKFYVFIDPNLSNYINADLIKIKEILINLIDNAIKFTQIGGKIIIRIIKIEDLPKDEIKIEFSVEDNGANINLEKIDEIFVSSLQEDDTNNKKYMSLGLGISKKLAVLMGGDLSIQSSPKNGNKFIFYLQVKEINITMTKNSYNIKIGVLSSCSDYFNNFLEKYLSSLKINVEFFEDINSLKKNTYKFDLIFIRFDDYIGVKSKFDKPIILSANYKILSSIDTNELDQNIFCISEPIKLTQLDKTIQHILSIKKSNPNYIIKNKIEKIDDKFSAKALVLTTNQTMQKLIKYILSYLYIETTIVKSTKELISEYTQQSYDIIFIEIEPAVKFDEHNIKSIIEFEKESKIGHSPIIAIIDNNVKTNDASIKNKGFDEFISQPIKINILSKLLNKLIPEHKIIPNLQLKQPEICYLTENKSIYNKDILIVKKSVLQNTLMKNKFLEFCENIDFVTNLYDFEKHIKEISYKLVIIDSNIPNLNLENISSLLLDRQTNKNVKIKTILMIDNEKNILEKFKNDFSRIIQEDMDINQISMIAKNLIK